MVFKGFLSKAKDIDILASIPDGVMLTGSDGKVEWTNEVTPALLKVNKSELGRLNVNEIIESGLDLIKQSAENTKSVVGRLKNTLGRDTYVEILAKAVEGYFVATLRDVTQNYKTVTNILVEHESSKKINKDKNAFLVKLSNELKSPIHSIIGFSQAMVDGLGGEMSEKQEKYIKIINKNSNELLYFMDKILELSKAESGLFDYDFQIFDITNTVQSVLKNYEPNIKTKNLNLTIESDELVKKTVFSDEDAFKVVLQNVIETSISATDIGSITIKLQHPELDFVAAQGVELDETSSEQSFLLLTVTDTGAGISEGDLGTIFEPYAQLDKANKKNIVRSIALATAKNLVKYLRGTIWMESEPMQGTQYNIIIPIERQLQVAGVNIQ